jgi:hypothetical protein
VPSSPCSAASSAPRPAATSARRARMRRWRECCPQMGARHPPRPALTVSAGSPMVPRPWRGLAGRRTDLAGGPAVCTNIRARMGPKERAPRLEP